MPRRVQICLGVLCDGERATCRIPQYKLDELNALSKGVMERVDAATLKKMAGKWTSMEVTARAALLWTPSVLKGARALDERRNGRWVKEIPVNKGSGLWEESELWLRVIEQ